MERTKESLRRTTTVGRVWAWTAAVVVAWSLAGAPTGVWAQETGSTEDVCRRALDGAEQQYQNRDYADAIQLVSACLNQDDVPDALAVRSYRLLALCYVRQDALDEARLAVLNLLGIDPDFEPDPINDPPPFTSLVAVVKREIAAREARAEAAPPDDASPARPTPFFRRTGTWLVIGGGLLVGGALSLVSLSGGGDGNGDGPTPSPRPSDLPPPPPDPGS